MIESRSRLAVKRDALRRHLIWHNTWLGAKNNIYISEFPKSGGTWFSQLLSECTGVPFPRNKNISNQPSILHSHNFPISSKHCIHFLRDGRDVMVSAYHYFLLSPSCDQRLQQQWQRKMSAKNLEDTTSHLAEFIGHFNRDYRVGFRRVRWSDFVMKSSRTTGILEIKYEQLHQEPETTLESAIHYLGYGDVQKSTIKKAIAKYDFKTQSERNKGEKDSVAFLRKGVVGDWKNYFNKESAEVFNFYASEALIKAGYETRADWY